MPGTGIYASNRALWFPIDGESVSSQDQADIVREFDWLNAPQRDMLTRLQHNQINLHHVANAHHATKQVNLLMGLSGFGTEALHSGVEVAIKAREHLESAVREVKTKLINMAEATSEDIATKATQDFRLAYQALASKYSPYLDELNRIDRYTLDKPWAIIRGLRKHGWAMDDIFTAKRLAGVVKYLKFVKIGGYVMLAVSGGEHVYDTWEQTHNWEKTLKAAGVEVLDIASVPAATEAIAGTLLFACVTAPEWLTCIAIGAAAVGVAELFDHFILNPLIEDI